MNVFWHFIITTVFLLALISLSLPLLSSILSYHPALFLVILPIYPVNSNFLRVAATFCSAFSVLLFLLSSVEFNLTLLHKVYFPVFLLVHFSSLSFPGISEQFVLSLLPVFPATCTICNCISCFFLSILSDFFAHVVANSCLLILCQYCLSYLTKFSVSLFSINLNFFLVFFHMFLLSYFSSIAVVFVIVFHVFWFGVSHISHYFVNSKRFSQ